MAGGHGGDVFRRALGDDGAAAAAALGTEVDDPVRGLDDVEAVLDHQHRVALFDQPCQHRQQPPHVVEVETRGRLVEQVDRVPRRSLGQLGGQLDPLGLAARQRRGRLPQPHVPEPDIHQRLHVPSDRRLVGEEVHGFGHRHVEHVGDVLALELDVEGVTVVASALAHLARHVHVRQEVHLDLDRAVAGAGLAPSALHVEAEPARHVPADLASLVEAKSLRTLSNTPV